MVIDAEMEFQHMLPNDKQFQVNDYVARQLVSSGCVVCSK